MSGNPIPHGPVIGVCGDDCGACPRLLATSSGDPAALEIVRELWVRIGLREPGVSAGSLACDGCSPSRRCAWPLVRDCAFSRGIPDCGRCGEFPCGRLEAVFEASEDLAEKVSTRCTRVERDALARAFLMKRENLEAVRGKASEAVGMGSAVLGRRFVQPGILFLAGLLLGFAADLLLHPRIPLDVRIAAGCGFVLISTGAVILASAAAALRRAGTPFEPSRTAVTLVTTGVYSRSRNPAYIGTAMIYSGVAAAAVSPVAVALLLPVMLLIDRIVVPREEERLLSRFGSIYSDYRERVGRWF